MIIAQSEYALEHAEDREHALQVIHTQAKKMGTMLSQLLLLARADRGTQKLKLERLDLSELCEIIAQQQAESETAEERRITVSTEIEPGIVVKADETMMMRILINLTENALRYNRDDGWVVLSLKKQGNKAVVSVRDNGIGIAPEDQARVWERFYQADPSHCGDGSGLGLAMVKWMVEAHGGRVGLHSEKGVGSEFFFELDMVSEEPKETENPKKDERA